MIKVSSNVEEVINNLNLFKGYIDASLTENLPILGKYCQTVARSNVISYEKDPQTAGNVINGITLDYGLNQAVITALDPNSMFYEYGTGTVGSNVPHPLSLESGWVYNLPTEYKRISSTTGELGWFHKFEGHSKATFLTGQPASAFMYKAYYLTLAKSKNFLNKVVKDASIRSNGK
jgi:hypothetical protein